jgi:hypothetical protein
MLPSTSVVFTLGLGQGNNPGQQTDELVARQDANGDTSWYLTDAQKSVLSAVRSGQNDRACGEVFARFRVPGRIVVAFVAELRV